MASANTDGPYKHSLTITLLNLPSHLRTSFNNIWLVGIIPPNGPKEPEIVVDEILSLSKFTTSAPLELKVLYAIQQSERSSTPWEVEHIKDACGVKYKV